MDKNKEEIPVEDQDSETPKAKKEPKKKKEKDEALVNNTIDVNPKLNEQAGKTVVVGWGRMNPITVGHEKLVNKIKAVAKQKKATPKVFLSHSQDKKKNPLEYKDKVQFAKMAFGRNLIVDSKANTIIKVMEELEKEYDNLVLVVGQDRVEEFKKLLNKYNGDVYNFDSIEIVSAGDRDPDAEGVEGMSASKMRALAVSGKAEEFIKGLPKKLQSRGRHVYDMVRAGMKLSELAEELEEAILSIAQRRKRGRTMKRYRAKIARARRRAMRRPATRQKLKTRSRRDAIKVIRKRVAQKQGVNYSSLSPSQKMIVDKKVARKKKHISKIAKRLIPQVRRRDIERRRARTEDVQLHPAMLPHQLEMPKKKRFHRMNDANGKPILDKRFKAFREKKSPCFEEIESDLMLLQLIEETHEDILAEKKYMDHDLWGTKKLASITVKKKAYKNALELLKKIVDRKKKEGTYRHAPEYYAANVARQYDVDARTLANMLDEAGGAGDEGTDELIARYLKDTPHSAIQEDKTKVPQDPDIKDLPGSQPKVYYKGLSDKEKEKRAAHFKRGTNKDDEDPSAYTPAPGDSDAKTKTSKHTKKYHQMYGEGRNMERAKEIIARLKRETKDEIDDIKDRARTADTREKNQQTEEYVLSEDSKEALKKKAEKSGIPYSILKKVYDRGMAAWRTGHRPGASQEQWAYARVNSFITKGEGTWGGADRDLASKVKKEEYDLNEEVTQKQLDDLEKFADRILQKFNIDVEFTRHFADRMNDDRNNPAIKISELQKLFKKIAKEKGDKIKKHGDAEAVIKDMQSDLNLPVVVNYKDGEFEVVNKTIMRKKNFKTPDPEVKYEEVELDEASGNLSPDEEKLLKKFTKKGEAMTITLHKSTGRIRGGLKKDVGVKEYEAAESLIDKGMLKLVDRSNDSYGKSLKVVLVGEPKADLSSFEQQVLSKVEAWVKSGAPEKGFPYGPNKGRKPVPKKEKDAIDRLIRLGHLKGSVLHPELAES